MDTKKTLTIFTPTYNRCETLKVLYESLKKQTTADFIWFVVDDGSTDETKEFLERCAEEKALAFQYIIQKNSGKMTAHNVGVSKCKTELFLCVDSDDFIIETAVEDIIASWNEIKNQKAMAGIIAYKGSNPYEPIGTEFPEGLKESALSDLYNIGFTGDTTLVFRTDVIKQYPFPVINGEKFITEAFVYDQIDEKYKYALMRKVLTICEYRDDGLTKNGMRLVFMNPGGWAARSIQQGNKAKTLIKRFKYYAWAHSYKLMAKRVSLPIVPKNRVTFFLSWPLGLLLYIRRMIKYR